MLTQEHLLFGLVLIDYSTAFSSLEVVSRNLLNNFQVHSMRCAHGSMTRLDFFAGDVVDKLSMTS